MEACATHEQSTQSQEESMGMGQGEDKGAWLEGSSVGQI